MPNTLTHNVSSKIYFITKHNPWMNLQVTRTEGFDKRGQSILTGEAVLSVQKFPL